MLKTVNLHWAAGFLEGEAAFMLQRKNPSLAVSQVEHEPLDKLVTLFGGRLSFVKRNRPDKPNWSDYWQWNITGRRAVGVMMTLFILLSSKRQKRIKEILTVWKTTRERYFNSDKTHCLHGHPLSGENLYLYKDGRRQCRSCAQILKRQWHITNRKSNTNLSRDSQQGTGSAGKSAQFSSA